MQTAEQASDHEEWTPTLLAIDEAITKMGTFKLPQPGFEGMTWRGWQLERAKRVLAAVENAQAREENIQANEPPAVGFTVVEKVEPKKAKRGWNWLFNSTKWHYFDETGQSLCGRWMQWGTNADAQDWDDPSVDNCKICEKKVKKMREREKSNE